MTGSFDAVTFSTMRARDPKDAERTPKALFLDRFDDRWRSRGRRSAAQ